MSNVIVFQNDDRAMARMATAGSLSLAREYACGGYTQADFTCAGDEKEKFYRLPSKMWIPDGVQIQDMLTVKSVNGQLLMLPEEDDNFYFFITGARGHGHNSHKHLLLPAGLDLLASGSRAAHTPGSCNMHSTVVFRVPRMTTKVMVGDLYYGDWSQAISFLRDPEKGWEVEVELYDRWCALNYDWRGPWSEGNPSLPLPALVE